MTYPRFTKIIINHFISQNKSISMRNMINLHKARDDRLLGTLKYVSKTKEHPVYGALIPKEMLNEDILNSTAYKTYYAYASDAKEPKKARKFKKPASPKLKTIPVSPKEHTKKPTKKSEPAKKVVPTMKSSRKSQAGVIIKDTPGVSVSKKKTPAKGKRSKGIEILSDVALTEATQLKEISGTDEGTGTKPGVPDIPKYDSENDNDNNDDDNDDDDGNHDDNDDDSYHERTESDRDENPNLNQSNEENEKEEEEYVDKFTDEEDNADNAKEENEEELDDAEELYRDVNVNLRKEDVEMTNANQSGADQHNVSQESEFEQEEEDAHVTLTAVHDTYRTDNEIASLMDTTIHHEEPSSQTSSLFTVPIKLIPKITSTFTTTIPPPHPFFNPLPQQATPTPTPTTSEVTTSFPALTDFASVFRFNESVTNLERDLEEALTDRREYIDLIDTSVRAIIKEEVNSQLPQILPQAVSEFATPVNERNVTESLEAVVLANSSSQPKSTYEAAASLSNFELTKILMDKMEEHKSYLRVDYKRELYDALVKSYNTNKDLFETYGEVFTLKRSRYDKDKDKDPSDGSDRGTKRRKSSKDAKLFRDPKSKESKPTSSSKGTSRSQHKSSGKSAHAEEQSHTVDDSGVRHNQEFDTGNNNEQPDNEAVSKSDWYKKPEQPPTPNPDWNKRQ
ncbi:hypothetical protein Tco_0896982 [Tanacetum coccineum]